MNWVILILAGLFETLWAVGLKYTNSFTRLFPSIYTLIAMAISVYLLSIAARSLPIAIVYAVWTGIGIVGVALVDIFIYKDPANLNRIVCIALILIGIVGLKILKN